MEIREIRDDEYRAAGDLAVAAYRAVPGMDRYHDHIEELRDIETRAQHNSVYVALLDDRLVGCVTYVPDPSSPLAEFDDPEAAAIRALAVDPDVQRSGVGRRLTEHCIAEARRRGRARLVLHTTAELVAAHSLYRSMGFERAPELDFLDGDVNLTAYAYDIGPEGDAQTRLDDIETKYRALCARIDTRLAAATLRRTPNHDGSSHVTWDRDGFCVIVTERGLELERRTTRDENELLYWLVADVAWGLASAYEFEHRRPGVSFRRLLFAKTIEYLRRVDAGWAAAKEAEFAAILADHPFDDVAEG